MDGQLEEERSEIAQNLLTGLELSLRVGRRLWQVEANSALMTVIRKRIPLPRREVQREKYLGRKRIIPSGFGERQVHHSGGELGSLGETRTLEKDERSVCVLLSLAQPPAVWMSVYSQERREKASMPSFLMGKRV